MLVPNTNPLSDSREILEVAVRITHSSHMVLFFQEETAVGPSTQFLEKGDQSELNFWYMQLYIYIILAYADIYIVSKIPSLTGQPHLCWMLW